MLQDMGCGNNVTRVLPPCLLKSGFVDCLFEGKEASDKHPVLKSSLDFAAKRGGRVILCRGERRMLKSSLGPQEDMTGLSSSVCHVQFSSVGSSYTS